MKLNGVATCLAFVVFLGGIAKAQQAPAAYVCNFTQAYGAAPEGGKFAPKPLRDTIAYTIAAVNLKAGTAQAIGSAGASELFVSTGEGWTHFFEWTGSGSLIVTSVSAAKQLDGRFYAVMSRHINIVREPVVSQYYGACEGKI